MKKMKKNKGITLIALVVTIVVLIILATVSINAVLGENGIIKKAELAKSVYANAIKADEESMNTLLEEYANVMEEDSTIKDLEPPTVVYTINPDNGTWSKTVTITIEATDESGIKSITNISTENITKINDTTYNVTENGDFRFKVTDNAGDSIEKIVTITNVSLYSYKITIDENTPLTAWGTSRFYFDGPNDGSITIWECDADTTEGPYRKVNEISIGESSSNRKYCF